MKPLLCAGYKTLLTPLSIFLFSIVIASCTSQPVAGISKDLNTGMVTTYNGLLTEEAAIVMNEEKVNHTDIPIGESFVIINKGVKGLVQKDGKVSVGCALTITDKAGKALLAEPDLFEGKNVFEKIDYLKCTVNTGKPMEPEEKYNVHVVFTDKNGTGKIENTVMIRMVAAR